MAFRLRHFRLRVLATMMGVIAGVCIVGAYLAERHAAADAERAVAADFQHALATHESARTARTVALTQRCAALARKARIHAALEDDALDLLYPNARDELSDLLAPTRGQPATASQAKFYRFLDSNGRVIPVTKSTDVGALTENEAAQLALPTLPRAPALGYLPRAAGDRGGPVVDEVITLPIFSTTNGQPIAALAVGFPTTELTQASDAAIRRGLWINHTLASPAFDGAAQRELHAQLLPWLGQDPTARSFSLSLGGEPHLALVQPLNPGSLYAPAYELSVYPLTSLRARQRTLRWKIVGLGTTLLVLGLAASHVAAGRISRPVEQLAADTALTVHQRDRATAALELTQAELQRVARFSSDASHQLKTPVAVFRAGLDELMARDDVTEPVREELRALTVQTQRLNAMIEDLLLLSRMESGRLQIVFAPVPLAHLVDSWLDDLSALPTAGELAITSQIPAHLHVLGERRYVSLILQNLLENARKYNRTDGRIAIATHAVGKNVFLTIGNSGTTIPAAAQPYIFDRFHRGAAGESIPGHGLGLNVARELARLHGGDIRLLTSTNDWTEFEISFQLANPAAIAVPSGI